MENKKNYIDGVDVSGCNNIDEWKHCNICQVLIKTIPNRHQCLTEGDLRCEFYPDCYYKQLQRLEQENAELKAENERLKANKGRCAFKCLDNTFCPEADKKITGLELSRDSYKVSLETARKYRGIAETDRDLYRQALQEIREIAKEQLQDVSDRCINTTPMYIVHKHIIDKINSVIGAE